MVIPRTFGGRGFFSAAISPHLFDRYFVNEPVLWAATFGVVVLCVYAIAERKRFAALMIYLGGWIIVTSLHGGVGNLETRLDPKFSNRYYFIFGFGLLSTVIFMLYSADRRVRVATACCVAALLAWSWSLPSPGPEFWSKYQAALQRYDQAKQGTEVEFPEVPKEWSFQVKKR
jgi:hypothetical protein